MVFLDYVLLEWAQALMGKPFWLPAFVVFVLIKLSQVHSVPYVGARKWKRNRKKGMTVE